jgi:RimJ/RimL family protein N-acetyltransferase
VPVRAQDSEELLALWRRPEVRRFLFDGREVTDAIAQRVLDDALEAARDGLGLWRVWSPAEGRSSRAAGVVGLMPVGFAAEAEPRLAGLVEIVAALEPESWGRGLATEALGALIRHAFDELALPRLAAVTDAPNERSLRLIARLGFDPLGRCPGPTYEMVTFLLDAPGAGAG